MNLQDRIAEILWSVRYRQDTVEDAAKAILALVEEEKLNRDIEVGTKVWVGKDANEWQKELRGTPTVSEQCCHQCLKCNGNHGDMPICTRINCPCHSPSSGVEPLGDGSVRCCDNGDFDEKHKCLKSPPVESTAPVGWESEFEDVYLSSSLSSNPGISLRGERIKDFIRQTIKNREREIAEGVAEMIDAHWFPGLANLATSKTDYNQTLWIYQAGARAALKDVLALLNKE